MFSYFTSFLSEDFRFDYSEKTNKKQNEFNDLGFLVLFKKKRLAPSKTLIQMKILKSTLIDWERVTRKRVKFREYMILSATFTLMIYTADRDYQEFHITITLVVALSCTDPHTVLSQNQTARTLRVLGEKTFRKKYLIYRPPNLL